MMLSVDEARRIAAPTRLRPIADEGQRAARSGGADLTRRQFSPPALAAAGAGDR